MTDKNDYRRLLGERIARAHLLQNEVEPPAAEDIACWKRLALAKKQERKRRLRNMATLASVLAVVCCASLVPLFHIPDAQADKDSFVEMIDAKNHENTTFVDTYLCYDDVPREILESFYAFNETIAGFELSEIRVITVNEDTKLEADFKNKEGTSFTIKQKRAQNETKVIANYDYVEIWNNIEVGIKTYSNNAKQTTYKFTKNNIFVEIIADCSVQEKIIKEAVFSL